MSKVGRLSVSLEHRGAKLGDLFGIFFEDLNHAADGGLYGELVRNRSFEFDRIDNSSYHALTAWEKIERGGGQAQVSIQTEAPLNTKNPHYAVIEIVAEGDGVGLMNYGYNTGISLKQGEQYLFSMYAKREDSKSEAEAVSIAVENPDGVVLAEASIAVSGNEWTRYEAILTAKSTDHSGRLILLTKGTGSLALDHVSLFPKETFKQRSNGMRQDIASMLQELKPKFMRFPGGCLVHDGSLNADDRNSMYRWKNTIGPVHDRPARRSNWGYNQTLGLGYYEYFVLSEDIGAKPIPVLPAGYDPHHKRIVPIEELGPWIDDALDLIEFANGSIETTWGAKRAELGHPEPFGMEYIAIGNEEVGEPFFERYTYFHNAIKARYPEMKIINSSGPFPAGGEYERGWASAREHRSDYVDEHYYVSPEWMLANIHRYASFSADDPKVFLGEYASWGNTYYNALAEAAYMTGLQNNAHAVGLACYAPLLCNVDYVNWRPDLIWFNNHQVFGTPNYYVQQLFMHHQGDYLLEMKAEGLSQPITVNEAPITGMLALGANPDTAEFWDIQLENNITGEIIKLDYATAQGSETYRNLRELGKTDWDHYTISFKARRLEGEKGFELSFGDRGNGNRYLWEIGGWQNQDSALVSFVNGRGSCLTQSLFTVETDVVYQFSLEVTGRQLKAYINGELINAEEDKPLVIEPLYYTASYEEASGDIIVKAVNVQNQSLEIAFDVSDRSIGSVEVYELCGCQLEDENDFAAPTRVSPKQKLYHVEHNAAESFTYMIQPHSITVLRLKDEYEAIKKAYQN
ncbi:alpha-L-arabinofuranosidase C-terminal domain-containing protein [Paenibacillus camelliae]|uniref:alpha-L-arabinofuranosidase C-terminal domain-containing protein n=1 Tax=Paenibacillus camelliae TaxID=512410 RepID=UPI0020426006|nr:alpha-L-arabinofuranosidase C-terminal domain-containing protein [Paenibacillus camelliae]MCM3632734.1 carbohydrate binding domain-containing protein [Paenibacillus camelliae]